MRKIFAIAAWIALPAMLGCAGHAAPFPAPPMGMAMAPDAMEAGRRQVAEILQALPAYREDGLAVFEVREIKTIEDDLAMIRDEQQGQEFLKEVRLLESDWEVLVALDEVLQKEGVI
ncbi:MAG TPA: hypothetical protein VGR96_15735 [Acidobacteriaceae bacterium]|nr:hypothetical protein [Acidobacteriaceae bacterium]